MNTERRRVHLVSHTHWDREWYLTFPTFQVDLVRVVDRVLDLLERDNGLDHFMLDGQTIVIEDYLAAAPENEERLRRAIERGALSIGPWYVLQDEFLVSGEANLRNLLIGRQSGRRFGQVQDVGYMPDSFGHIAQLPQLLRLAGLDSFVYTRGDGDEIDRTGDTYLWTAPDGSEVLAIHQAGGYTNGGGLGHAELWHAHTRREIRPEIAVEQMKRILAAAELRGRGEPVLVNNGCDHFPPQAELAAILAALAEAFPAIDFATVDLRRHVDAVAASNLSLERRSGELLGGKIEHILSGVWSTRLELKQANEICQNLLSRLAEPVFALGHLLGRSRSGRGVTNAAWRLLLQNHAHDSICGCSIDEVHRAMLPRFVAVKETAERLLARTLEDIVPTFARRAEDDAETTLAVVNTLPRRRDELVERIVVVDPALHGTGEFMLVNEEGEEVPCEIVDRLLIQRFWSRDWRREVNFERARTWLDDLRRDWPALVLDEPRPAGPDDLFLHLRFMARDLPALGHRLYFLRPAARRLLPEVAVGADANLIENEHLALRLHPDGRFDLVMKANGRSFPGLHVLEDVGDRGDSYDFAAVGETIRADSAARNGRVEIVARSALLVAIEARFDLPLPIGLEADRERRSAATELCSVRVRLTLEAAARIVEIETEFDNRVCDHRLRASFRTSIKARSLVSDGQYMLHSRPLVPSSPADWRQPHCGSYPQQDFSLLADEKGGLALFNRGLPEIAPLVSESSAGFALTLHRGLGWLSRGDLPSRRCESAGPTIAVPEAQGLGRRRTRYALMPFAGTALEGGIAQASAAWRTPPATIQGVRDGALTGQGALLEQARSEVVVTAIKWHEERDALVIRMCNLADHEVVETLRFGFDCREAARVDLFEERLAKAAPLDFDPEDRRRLFIPLRAHEILTIMVEPA